MTRFTILLAFLVSAGSTAHAQAIDPLPIHFSVANPNGTVCNYFSPILYYQGAEYVCANNMTYSVLNSGTVVVNGSVSGTAALGTAAVGANACATAVTAVATGATASSAVIWTPNADISTIIGYGAQSTDGLKIYPYATANNVNFRVCNGSAASITPGAVTLNWTVLPSTTIFAGSQALGTAAIAANACATAITLAAAGVATTDTVQFAPNADISSVTGYGVAPTDGLKIYTYPTANNVNIKICNGTAASITPGAATLNLRVAR